MPPSSIFLIPENQLGMLRPLKPPRLQGEAETFCPPLPPPQQTASHFFVSPTASPGPGTLWPLRESEGQTNKGKEGCEQQTSRMTAGMSALSPLCPRGSGHRGDPTNTQPRSLRTGSLHQPSGL